MVIDTSVRSPDLADLADLADLTDLTDVAFSIEMRGVRGAVLLSGELDGQTAALLECVLDTQIAHGHLDVCVDAGGLTFFDLRGVSVLCEARRRLHELGGRLRVINADRLFHTVAAWRGVPDLCDHGTPAPWPGASGPLHPHTDPVPAAPPPADDA